MDHFDFHIRCVEADGDDITEMVEQASRVSATTFMRRCNWRPVARRIGYSVGSEPGLKLKSDYAVRFYRSRYKGRRCYFMDWSRIEYVFVRKGN